jgi:DNA-binding MarR family transcriptional regulator
MKTLMILLIKKIRTIVTILFLSLMLGGMTSCMVTRHADNGEHRGWFHKPNNQHDKRGAVLIITPNHRNDDKHRHNDKD